MLSLQFRKIKPERESQLRAWFAELNARAEEVRMTFRDEGVQHEQGVVLPTSDGPVLVWAAQLNDPDEANRAFAKSSHTIESELRAASLVLDQRRAIVAIGQASAAQIKRPGNGLAVWPRLRAHLSYYRRFNVGL